MTPVHFAPLNPGHLPRLTHWLQQPHVREFWDDGERDEVAVWAHYFADPERDALGFVFSIGGQETGYLQAYPVTADSEFALWRAEDGETWGIDLLIGEPDLVGRGWGPQAITAFLGLWCSERPRLRRMLIDPATENVRAIRAYQRAGFVPLSPVVIGSESFLLMARDEPFTPFLTTPPC